jgi:putative membrane protein
MPGTWLDRRAERAFQEAVTRIESASAAEVAIAVRRSAQAWPHVPVLAGAAAAWATLAFMLYSEPAFALVFFLLDPLLVGAVAAGVAVAVPSAVRWLTPHTRRRRAAAAAARATFVERGVHRTRGRTGVLIYCALTERIGIIVADAGVEAAVPAPTLVAWEREISAAIARGGVATAEAVASISAALAEALPRSATDANELHDAIDHDIDRRPRT